MVTNAGNYFSDLDYNEIKTAAKNAGSYFVKEYGFDYDVDIVVTPPSSLLKTIPQDGIGGRTYSSRLIVIVLNKDEAEITYETVFEMICHELAHSIRWEKLPEHAMTLFEGIIMEGLAVALEEKALEDNDIISKQFFLQTILETSPTEIEELISKLKKDFEATDYDYEKIFFTGDATLPKWAGYKLGYHFVRMFIAGNKVNIVDATTASYKSFSLIPNLHT